MAIQKFCGRVHHHVRAQRQRLLKIGRHECVIDHKRNFFLAANLTDSRKITQPHQRIRRRLHINHPSIFANRAFNVLRLRGIDVSKLQPKTRHHVVKQSWRATVKVVAAHHVVTRFQQADDRIDRSHATRKDGRCYSTFESRKICL